MSLSRQLLTLLWPWRTLGVAHLEWQALENRLFAAQGRLDRDYRRARRQAEQVLTDPAQGVLRVAQVRLEQPLDRELLLVKERLARIFARRGRGFFRRLPAPLELELAHYAAALEQTSRSYGELGARLRLAQALLALFQRHPDFCRPHFFRLALTAPESAWLLFHLRHQRLQNRRALAAKP